MGGHHHDESTSVGRLAIVAVINFIGFILEFIGGLLLGSLALIADSFHMLSDSFSYVLALFAAIIATRYEPNSRRTFGLHRAEPFAALINGLLLVPLFGFVIYHSYERYLEGISINAEYAIIVAVVGLLINVISLLVLDSDSDSVNEKTAWRHLAVDAGASLATILGLALVIVTGQYIFDVIFALIIAVFILWTVAKIFKDSGSILMQFSQKNLDSMTDSVENIDGIDSVTDIHSWNTCGKMVVLTMHVRTDAENIEERENIRKKIYDILERYEVDHATVEIDGNSNLKHHHH